MASYVNRDLAHSYRFDVTDSDEYADSGSFTVSATGQVVTFGQLTVVSVTPQDADGIFMGQFGKPTMIYNLPVVGENVDEDDVNEVVSVDITGTPTGGDFTLTFGGQETAAIAYDADASAVESALEALSSIGAGNVAVTGSNPTFTVTFQGALAGTNVGPITKDETGLTGGASPDIAISVDTAGVDGDVAVSVGDIIYKDVATAELNVDSTNGIEVGIALGVVTAGATTTIPVLKTT